MKKTNRATQADARLQQLLISLEKDYNTKEFKPFDSKLYREAYSVGAQYIAALKDLNAVENTYGKLKLTPRFYTLRPSTLRKRMNTIQLNSLSNKQPKQKPAAVSTTPVYNVAVLKAQLRQEVIDELKNSLTMQLEVLAKLK